MNAATRGKIKLCASSYAFALLIWSTAVFILALAFPFKAGSTHQVIVEGEREQPPPEGWASGQDMGSGNPFGEGGAGEGIGGSGEVELAQQLIVDSVDDMQCMSDADAAKLKKDGAQVRSLGRVTSADSYESRYDAAKMVVDIARLRETINSLVVGRFQANPGDALTIPIVRITYADGGYEDFTYNQFSMYPLNSITGSPAVMGSGQPSTKTCTKG